MADVRFNFDLGRTTFVIHDRDPVADGYYSSINGDSVEVRSTATNGQVTHAHFEGYPAYNRITNLGVREMRTINYGQLREISSHLDAARAALQTSQGLDRETVNTELVAAENLLARNNINRNRGYIAHEISLIRQTALQQECRDLMQRVATYSDDNQSVSADLNEINSAANRGLADRYVRDLNRMFTLFTQLENPEVSQNRSTSITELTRLLDRYEMPHDRLEQIIHPRANAADAGDGC